MKRMNFHRYKPYPTIDLPDRQWPSKTITKAPIWCSVDLRDGNQALRVPMNLDEKLKMFDLLVEVGFKEIEIGFFPLLPANLGTVTLRLKHLH